MRKICGERYALMIVLHLQGIISGRFVCSVVVCCIASRRYGIRADRMALLGSFWITSSAKNEGYTKISSARDLIQNQDMGMGSALGTNICFVVSNILAQHDSLVDARIKTRKVREK